ncbi:MAG: hypothetical protein PVF54_01730 [Anaerolineae bacterium]
MSHTERTLVDIISASRWRQVAAVVILMSLLVGFGASGWEEVLEHWSSRDSDQSAYMEIALDIRRGIALTDGNRHPFYPSLLAPIAGYHWAYFTTAKLLNLVIGTLTLCVAYWVVTKVSSMHAALLAVFLSSQAHRFLDSATKVVVEPSLALIVIPTWYLVWENRGSAIRAGLAGLGAGLAYLAKGTGQIIFVAFLAASVVTQGRHLLRKRDIWRFVFGYAALASVLWLSNALRYGNPFYSFSTTHAMWLDTWEDRYVIDAAQLPTLMTYLRSHSLQQIVRRLSNGLISVLKPMRQTWVPHPEFIFPLDQTVGLAILILRATSTAERTCSRDRVSPWQKALARLRAHREGAVFTVILLGLWYVLFAWYSPVSDSARFFLPVAPIVHCGIASGLVLGIRVILDEFPSPRGKARAALVSVGYTAVAAVVLVSTSNQVLASTRAGKLKNPYRWDVKQNADADALLQ